MQREFNWLGQMRVDVPHLRSVTSSIAREFDILAGDIFAGTEARVITGFQIIGTSGLASLLQLNVAGGTMLHPLASESGTLFKVPTDREAEVLSATNERVSGSFTASQVNYIGIDLLRSADDSTTDLVQFLDADTEREEPKTVPLGRTLDYVIYISTTDFGSTPNIAPIAKVTTDADNHVTNIEDARAMMFRLGSGGSVPDPQNAYPWPQGRTEDTDDFSSGDKAIASLKDMLDALMTRVWELGGGERWYAPTADRNVRMIRAGATFNNGEWFSWDGTDLLWKGLSFVFDNSTGYINEVADQTSTSSGLTNLSDGDCVYVDLDRTQDRTGLDALTPLKTAIANLSTPTVPGSRYVIAWRVGSTVYTRDSSFPVGATFDVATTTALGIVKLSKAPTDSAAPIVLTDTEKNAASGVAALDSSRKAIATGLTRDTAGTMVVAAGANDSSLELGKSGANTDVMGYLRANTIKARTGSTISAQNDVDASDHTVTAQDFVGVRASLSQDADLVGAIGGGFGEVFLTGSGPDASHVFPAGKVTGNTTYTVEIQTGGPRGTATFRVSTDGGATWVVSNVLTTNAGGGDRVVSSFSMVDDVIAGVLDIGFATGTYVTGDRYTFSANCFRPLVTINDSTDNIRTAFDHNGLRSRRQVGEFYEVWADTARWTNGGSPTYTNEDPDATFRARFMKDGGFNSGGTPLGGWLYATKSLAYLDSDAVVVMEWDGYESTIDGGCYMGFTIDADNTAIPSTGLWFKTSAGGSYWQAATGDGSEHVATSYKLVARSTTVPHRFRIEFHGSSTPIGSTVGSAFAYFFVDDIMIDSIGANIPDSVAVRPFFSTIIPPSATYRTFVGPVNFTWTRALSPATV